MTSTLGQYFTPEQRNAFAIRITEIKNVFRRFCTSTEPPKIKILILIRINGDNLGCVLINTCINAKALSSSDLTDLHIPIKASDYKFLSHDSYIDCSYLYELQRPVLHGDLKTSPEIMVGTIDDPLYVVIVGKLKNAETITPKTKKKYSLI